MNIYWLLHFRRWLQYRAVRRAAYAVARATNLEELKAAEERYWRAWNTLVKHTPKYRSGGSFLEAIRGGDRHAQ